MGSVAKAIITAPAYPTLKCNANAPIDTLLANSAVLAKELPKQVSRHASVLKGRISLPARQSRMNPVMRHPHAP
jgi:hypothetical protein